MKTIVPAIALFALMAAGATTSADAACNTCAPRVYAPARVCNTCPSPVVRVEMERVCVPCNTCNPCGGRGWGILPWNW